jgi:diketogulonate reductase-like aldo/keto reductase
MEYGVKVIPSVMLSSGTSVARLGLGTWRMGEDAASRSQEVAVLRHGIASGITLIDTAEMYGDGGAEEVVGEAIRGIGGQRDGLFLVSKVYPWNASRRGTVAACERSLKRMGTDRIDLSLLHWRGDHPLADTVAAFEQLKRDGKIGQWGVSNFDRDDIDELLALPEGSGCVVNQVYYNLAKRWPEARLMERQRAAGIATMAYSPLDQGRLIGHRVLKAIAARHDGATAVQVALAWLLQFDDVITIPKTSRVQGVDEILGACNVKLRDQDLAELNVAFPLPKANARLETT